MNNLHVLLIGLGILFLTQSAAYVQTNGQFLWPWFKEHPFLVSLVFGSVIGFGFITSATYITEYFDGSLWPARIFSFSIGVTAFALMTYLLKGEGLTLKTIVCIVLALAITLIQIFWNEKPSYNSRPDDGHDSRTECTG